MSRIDYVIDSEERFDRTVQNPRGTDVGCHCKIVLVRQNRDCGKPLTLMKSFSIETFSGYNQNWSNKMNHEPRLPLSSISTFH